MKKILILSLLYLFCTQYGVAETKKGQKKSLTLGQQWQQEYVETMRELKVTGKKVNCQEIDPDIDTMIAIYDTLTDFDQKRLTLQYLAFASCPKLVGFFQSQIRKDTSEEIRCNAISHLSKIDTQSSIPFLLEWVQRSDISLYEKAVVGTTLAFMEDYLDAEPILNANCFSTETKFCQKCIWAYYMLGNNSSIKYYRYQMANNPDSNIICMSARLAAELGDVKEAFPVLKKMLRSDEEYRRSAAISGLEAIDNRKSINLISTMRNDPSPVVQRSYWDFEKKKHPSKQNQNDNYNK